MSDVSNYSTVEYWSARVKSSQTLQTMLFVDPRFDAYERRCNQQIGHLVSARTDPLVLDVACGYGRFAPVVEACGGRWHGVDFCPEMREIAEQQFPDVRWLECFHVADAKKPSPLFDGDLFDVIFEVNAGHSLQLTPEGFRDVYLPFLKIGGCIAWLEADEFVIYHDYATKPRPR